MNTLAHMRRTFLRLVAVVAIATLAVGIAPAKEEWQGVKKIVAVGDIHGDYSQFVALLRSAGLIDEDHHWIGGETHLVQTGDVPDRGPDTRKIMDLLMRLEDEAQAANGYVHALIGNHEAMNVYGQLNYVHPGEYASFATEESEELQEKAYEQHKKELKAHPPAGGLPDFNDAYRAAWCAKHPLGYDEHRKAFDVSGTYGKWIAGHNAVIKINDTVFLHGGIGPSFVGKSIKSLNRSIVEELRDFSKLQAGVATNSEGPLWYRGLAQQEEAIEKPHLEELLDNLDAKRIVIGHTVSPGTVWPRFGGRVVMIDVGMSAAYGGRLACLVIEDGVPYTLHRGTRIDFPKDDGPDLLRYAKEAAALDPQPSPLASVITKLEDQ